VEIRQQLKGDLEVKVPFVDLKAQHQGIKGEIESALSAVVADCAFVGGKYVQDFEEAFATFCGCDCAVGVSSGTSALHLALMAMGIGAGDEVITAANTFIATTEAVTHAGARFRLVDIDSRSYGIDPSLIEAAVTGKTKAIIPVHLYGQPADMDPINEIAARHDLLVLEDAAQAQGAKYKGKRAGALGNAAAFSFYPAKNLGACGDAGAVVTDRKEIADGIRLLANHGRRTSTDHSVEGYNARLDGIQAAILSAKLTHLEDWNAKRRQAAKRYNSLLAGLDVVLPEEMPYAEHIYHLYVIRVKNRDTVMKELAARDIYCGLHYPIPLHLLDAYKRLNKPKGSYPVTERVAAEILSLPMYPEITVDQQKYVADSLRDILEKTG
jgi:dTDP-4-amino-4,6-dideoxygalactose transaminase